MHANRSTIETHALHNSFVCPRSDRHPTQIPSAKASYVIPTHFEEKIIRVFSKQPDSDDSPRVKSAIKTAFRKFLRNRGLCSPVSSPVVVKRRRDFDNSATPSSDADEGLDQVASAYVSHVQRGGSSVGMTVDERMAKRTKPVPDFLHDSI